MNLLAETAYDYNEFFLIVGIVFGLVLICSIVLIVHLVYLHKKDKKNNLSTKPNNLDENNPNTEK